jgi:hypothetical protein
MLYSPPPRTKVLLCIASEEEERLKRILDRHDLQFVRERSAAMQLLEKDEYGLVVVGVHFDGSQAFSLIGDLRLHAKYRKVPILVVYAPGRYDLSDLALEAIDRAVLSLTANGFLNFSHFADTDEHNERIRRIADYLILINGDLHHVARQMRDPQLLRVVERRSE